MDYKALIQCLGLFLQFDSYSDNHLNDKPQFTLLLTQTIDISLMNRHRVVNDHLQGLSDVPGPHAIIELHFFPLLLQHLRLDTLEIGPPVQLEGAILLSKQLIIFLLFLHPLSTLFFLYSLLYY